MAILAHVLPSAAMALAKRAVAEIRDLHRFFEAWLGGNDDRDRLLAELRAAHGKRPGLQIDVREPSCRWDSWDACLICYEEVQRENGALTARYSSALFVAPEQTSNRVQWLHVHETWLPR